MWCIGPPLLYPYLPTLCAVQWSVGVYLALMRYWARLMLAGVPVMVIWRSDDPSMALAIFICAPDIWRISLILVPWRPIMQPISWGGHLITLEIKLCRFKIKRETLIKHTYTVRILKIEVIVKPISSEEIVGIRRGKKTEIRLCYHKKRNSGLIQVKYYSWEPINWEDNADRFLLKLEIRLSWPQKRH